MRKREKSYLLEYRDVSDIVTVLKIQVIRWTLLAVRFITSSTALFSNQRYFCTQVDNVANISKQLNYVAQVLHAP